MATRANIVQAADKLFLERGFQNVSLEEVADACMLSVRTVLRYFETKEALALSHEYDFLERFRSGLDNHEGPVLDYWRSYVGAVAAGIASNVGWYRRRVDALQPLTLWLHVTGMQHEHQMLLAEALATESGDGVSLRPHLLAAALVTANERVVRFARNGETFDPEWCVAAVDYVTTLLDQDVENRLPPMAAPAPALRFLSSSPGDC